MKEFFKKKLLFATMVMGTLIALCTGCGNGSSVDTTLTINDDMSGERTMVVTIDSDNFNDYFSGTFSDLVDVCEAYCPSEMTYSADEEALVVTFTLAFSSIDDYNSKISAILDDDDEWITISTPDSIWASGISIEEDVYATDLLEWLSDALVEEGYVSSDNASSIFSAGDNYVIYKGESYSSYSSYIYVDTVESLSLDYIDILTEAASTSTFNRTVVFHVPESSMSSKGDEILAYMESLTPSNASYTTEDGDDGETLIIYNANDLSADDLLAFDLAIFGEASIESAELTDTPLVKGTGFDEEISLDNFISSWGIYVYFYMKPGDDIAVSNYGLSSSSFSDITESGYYDLSDEYDGYYYITYDYTYTGYHVDFSMKARKSYLVSDIDISSTNNSAGTVWTRTTTITLFEVPSEDDQSLLVAAFEAILPTDETDSDSEDVSYGTNSISSKSSSDSFSIVITQSGSCEEVEASSKVIFGDAGIVSYTCDEGFFTIKKNEEFTENINLYYLVPSDIRALDYNLHYSHKLGFNAKSEYAYAISSTLEDDEELVNGSTFAFDTDGYYIYASYTGTYTNIVALIIIIVIIIIILAAAVLAFLILKKSIANRPAAPAPTANAFCTSCGAKLVAGNAFCTSCGSKAN